MDINALNERVKEKSAFVDALYRQVGKRVVGQREMIRGMLIAMLCEGHILLEGVPGLAKTLSVSSLAESVALDYQRIQFTPDLLPADLTGAEIYNAREGTFSTRKGPLFANIILADEINRAPAKVQAALLEAMQERQITIGAETYPLPQPFLTLATMNPIDQEGTYPLPEAQIDRFMLKVKVDYPTIEEEREIVTRYSVGVVATIDAIISGAALQEAKEVVESIYIDGKLIDYIVTLIATTRTPEKYGLKIGHLIEFGASPRASIYLTKAARANAFLNQRGYVIPDDIKQVAPDVLRHRVAVSYEADAEGVTSEEIVRRIFDTVEVP